MTDFRIDQTGSHTRVWLHGIEITKSMHGVKVEMEAGHVARVELDLRITSVEITALAEENHTIMVVIPDEVMTTLELLGWVKSSRTTYSVPRVEGEYA
jgi:hypothetical protein